MQIISRDDSLRTLTELLYLLQFVVFVIKFCILVQVLRFPVGISGMWTLTIPI